MGVCCSSYLDCLYILYTESYKFLCKFCGLSFLLSVSKETVNENFICINSLCSALYCSKCYSDNRICYFCGKDNVVSTLHLYKTVPGVFIYFLDYMLENKILVKV